MPCQGCKKRDEINMGVKGKFWMRFVGKPNGVFMKGAPGNFVHGEKYYVPYGHSKFPFWELLEEVPVLEVSEDLDGSVFEETVFIPDEAEEEVTVDEWSYAEPVPEITISAPVLQEVTTSTTIEPQVEMVSNSPIDNSAPAIIQPYGTFSPSTGEVGEHKEELVVKNREENPVQLTRKELLKILSDGGEEVKKGTRTTTLRKMVDKLEEA